MSTFASSAAVGPPPGLQVRLSSNESPFGPSPTALAAARAALDDAHLYPDDQSSSLRAALAQVEGVTADEVTLGTGSCGLLMDLVAHECRDGGSVLAYERAFVVYRLAARNAGVGYRQAPVGPPPASVEVDGYARDPQALLDAIDDDTQVVLIDNPANPTGAHLDAHALAAVVEGVPEHVTLVVDEAYWQYATAVEGVVRARDLPVTHPRLVVTSTFSKAHGLAGLRVGAAIAAPELAQGVDAWRARFNVNAVAQAAAEASLHDTDHLWRGVDGVVEGRARMAAGLRDLGVPVTAGLGNFVLVELGEDAGRTVEAFAAQGVGVRPLRPYGLDEQVRVSVGTPEEVDRFLEVASDVLARVPSRG